MSFLTNFLKCSPRRRAISDPIDHVEAVTSSRLATLVRFVGLVFTIRTVLDELLTFLE